MLLCKKIKLNPNAVQTEKINQLMDEYVLAVNQVLEIFKTHPDHLEHPVSGRDIKHAISYPMRSMAIEDAKRLYRVQEKINRENEIFLKENPQELHQVMMHSKTAKWDSFQIKQKAIQLTGWLKEENEADSLHIPFVLSKELRKEFIDARKTAQYLQLNWKKHKLICSMYYEVPEKELLETKLKAENPDFVPEIMGIDLNIRHPAVCVTTSGKVLFAGNGRENSYKRRHYKAIREKHSKNGNVKEFEALGNKEHHYMHDQDHKISRQIIDFALKNHVTEIHLEDLYHVQQNIPQPSKRKRHQISTWSFYRLSKMIEYKAHLQGIKVEYVSPVYTSQICPKCKEKTKMIKGSMFQCASCGYTIHNDLMAAMNIRDKQPINKKTTL